MFRPVEFPPIPEATTTVARAAHPRGTDAMRVRDALGPLFTDDDFADGPLAGMFSDLGRPGLSPGLLLMVSVLQFRHNLSDREAAEALADRISWKYALSRELEDTGVDFPTNSASTTTSQPQPDHHYANRVRIGVSAAPSSGPPPAGAVRPGLTDPDGVCFPLPLRYP
jgi:transposase